MSIVQVPLPQTEKILDYFPDVECPIKPFGDRVVVQIQAPRDKSAGGIIIPDPEGAKYVQQTALVKAIGEGPYERPVEFKVGDFVRTPLYGGDKVEVPAGKGVIALFVTFRTREILGLITCDPLKIKTTI